MGNVRYDGKDVFHRRASLEPYFWRAPCDNDYGNQMPQRMGIWRQAHVNRKVTGYKIGEQTTEGVTINVEMVLSDLQQPYQLTYLIGSNGTITVSAHMDSRDHKLPELPRFGMRLVLPKGYEQVNYYGRGPLENYPDRKTSQFIGRYQTTVTDMYYPYILPQQTGNHCDVRWATISNTANTISFEAVQPIGLDFSALHFKDEDLDHGNERKMLDQSDMYPRRETYVIIGSHQRGLGGDNSWGDMPHKEYRLFDGEYTFSFRLSIQSLP